MTVSIPFAMVRISFTDFVLSVNLVYKRIDSFNDCVAKFQRVIGWVIWDWVGLRRFGGKKDLIVDTH